MDVRKHGRTRQRETEWEWRWSEQNRRKSFYNRLRTKSRMVPIGILYIFIIPVVFRVCVCVCVCAERQIVGIRCVLDIGYLQEKCYILMSFVWNVPLVPKLEIRHKEVVDANGEDLTFFPTRSTNWSQLISKHNFIESFFFVVIVVVVVKFKIHMCEWIIISKQVTEPTTVICVYYIAL